LAGLAIPFPSNDGMIFGGRSVGLGFDYWWEDGINKRSAATAAVYKIKQSTQHPTLHITAKQSTLAPF